MERAMIRVQLFASLKDTAGDSCIELPLSDETSVSELFSMLIARFPEFERYRSIVLTAVNEEYADWDTLVGPGDSVAFFPPVSGGAP